MKRRIFAMLLAVISVLAFSTTTFAASSVGATGTITVANPISGETYTAYKIFDVTYDNNNDTIPLASGDVVDHYAYTIESTSPWFTTVSAYAGGTASAAGVYTGNGLTLTPAVNTASPIVYVVTVGASFSAADFAETLKTALTRATNPVTDPDAEQLNATSHSATGLDLGYWFVSTNSGSLCNLTTTNPNQIIYDKNQPLTLDKTVDDADQTVEVGQVLTYTLTADLPKDVTGYTHFYYEIGDTMTPGLTYRCIESATIGNTNLGTLSTPIAGFTYTHGGIDPTTGDEDMNGFNVVIDFATKNSDGTLAFESYLGETLTITYRAIVDEDAIERSVERNTATMKYSNDPNDSNSYEEVPDVSVDVYTLNIAVEKIGAESTANNKVTLKDAQFVLYKLDNNNVKQYYLYGTRDGFDDVQWVALPNGVSDVTSALEDDADFCTVRTTDTNGDLDDNFEGLDAGTYYLEEIKSPAGYNLPSAPFTVVITKNVAQVTHAVSFSATVDGETATVDTDDLTVETVIENQSGTILPSTGGFGTTMLIAIGSVLFMATSIILVTKKRMYNEG